MANKDWPPGDFDQFYRKFREWGAWYSGSRTALMNFYAGQANEFWAEDITDDRKTMLHIPVAGDIAGVSADLLLSEPPEIKIPKAHQDEAPSEAIDEQDRLDEMISETDLYSRLLEAAESASALGGVYLKVNWDTEFRDYPIISVAQSDNAIPEFKWGFLNKVTFHKVLDKPDSNLYWRQLEIHEPGVIRNELWKGGKFDLGSQYDLSARSETQDLEPVVETGIDTLACRYIPNKKPNRLWRGSNLGQSDLSGIEDMMDSIDETYTSWMRDVRLAKGRIIVPDYMLEKNNGKWEFDVDREVFTALSMGPASAEKPAEITPQQFDIRAEKHKNTAQELLEKCFTTAGYSPQSFGMEGEAGNVTATEIKAKESKSFKTRAKKARHLKNNLEEILQIALKIDREKFNGATGEYRPQVNLQDSIETNPINRADSINKLVQAQALSIDTRVRMLHPDWGEDQIEKEVERIMDEQGMNVEPPEVRV